MAAADGLACPTSIKLVVPDLAKAETFYRAICTFKKASTLHFAIDGRPFSEVILRDPEGRGSLTLMAYDDGDAPHSGCAVLTFSTDDLGAFTRRAIDAGATVLSEPRGLRLGGWNALIGEFVDPDGTLLQVVQTVDAPQ